MARTLRPVPGEDARAWTAQVFAVHDYAGAALFGDPATWQCQAARALLRGDAASFAALADFAEPEARFFAAAARFVHGDTARAQRQLAGIDLPHARNLAALLARGRIRVLAQLPWSPGAMTDLAAGARHDALFELRTVGHRAGDVAQRPYASVASLCEGGFAPDFYVATMVEWHHVPPDLQALGCPLFGHVADHDLHIQTIRPWLDLFDELCVTDRTEWLDVQGLSRGAVSSFAKVFGMPRSLPPLPDASSERHLDFFVSGTMLDPYHPDKARVLHELLAMPELAMRLVRGHTGTLAFHALLAASKASFTFVRRPGAMPTRGLESLALGCAVALQEESILNLWVGANEGAVTYGNAPGDLARAVRRVVDGWSHFGPAARAGAELVRREFALPRVASQYLRFLAFRAAAPRARREPVATAAWCQKRLCVSRTWLPDDALVRRRTMQANFRRLAEIVAKTPSPAVIVDMARELLCEFAFYQQKGEVGADERALHDDALRLLEKCARLYPRHLAARFLHVRTLWHHGDARARLQALQLAFDTIEADPASWQLGPDDDVMPFDFHADCFNYRDYLDLVAAAAKGTVVPAAAFVQLVLAAIAGYVARKTDQPDLHERVVAWDPGFARYRLDLARCLLRRGDGAQRARGLALLQELAGGSAEFAAAVRELTRRAQTPPAATARALQRLDSDCIDAALRVSALFATERAPAMPAPPAGVVGYVSPASAAARRFAVLVPFAGGARELAELLGELEGQTTAAAMDVVVALAPGEAALAARLVAGTHLAVRAVRLAGDLAWADRLSACVRAATAPFATVALPGDRFRADAFERLRAELEQHADAGIAFANEGWTAGEVARFQPSACVGFTCAPPAAWQRLATTNGIGAHTMWRRALHEAHGSFDASLGAACEYEFWLRAAPHTQARQLPLLLSTSCANAAWRAHRDPAQAPAAVAVARARHLGDVSEPFRAQQPLPVGLFAPGIREEAASHARLGVIGDGERAGLEALETFLGTALVHGDTATALCLLRAAAASAPSMLAPQLALAGLLDALGLPAHDVIARARQCRPYDELLAQRPVLVPTPDTRPEVLRCR
jgi:hypothetical protein